MNSTHFRFSSPIKLNVFVSRLNREISSSVVMRRRFVGFTGWIVVPRLLNPGNENVEKRSTQNCDCASKHKYFLVVFSRWLEWNIVSIKGGIRLSPTYWTSLYSPNLILACGMFVRRNNKDNIYFISCEILSVNCEKWFIYFAPVLRNGLTDSYNYFCISCKNMSSFYWCKILWGFILWIFP